MRVLHLVGQLGQGGTERQLSLMLRAMQPARVCSRLLVFNSSPHGDLQSAIADTGCEIEILPESVRGRFERLMYLIRLCRSWRPDVMHSWTPHDNVYAGLVGRLLGIASFGSVRGSLLREDVALSRFQRWASLRLVDRLVVNSRYLADEVAALGVERGRTFVLRNCVEIPDEAGQGSTRRELPEIPAAARCIGMVGNLRRVKNHELFLRGVSPILLENDDVWAVIVGQTLPSEPEVESRLTALCESLGIRERVLFAGFRSDARSLLERFEMLCLTSRSEGFPNVVLEAMAARLPVIATSVGGVPELVEDGVTGVLIGADDVVALTTSIRHLLGSPAVAREMALAGRARIEALYQTSEVSDRLVEWYVEAV